MRNLTLKQGDLVKMTLNDPDLGRLNFGVGQVYTVSERDSALVVISSIGAVIELVDSKGQMTDYAYHFVTHKCPVVLPIGNQNKVG